MPNTKEITSSTLLNEANNYLNKNEPSKALPLYLEYLERNPYDPEILVNVAIIYLHKKKYNEFLDYLEESCTLKPNALKYDYLLQIYQLTKNIDRGTKYFLSTSDCFEKFLAICKLNITTNYEIFDSNFILACNENPYSNKLLFNIIPAYSEKPFNPNMINIYRDLEIKYKNSIPIGLLYSNMLVKLNDYDTARNIIEKKLEIITEVDAYLAYSLVYGVITVGCGKLEIKKMISIFKKNKLDLELIMRYSGIKELRTSKIIKEEVLEYYENKSSSGYKKIVHWPWIMTEKTKGKMLNIKLPSSDTILDLNNIIKNETKIIHSLDRPDFLIDYLGIDEKSIRDIKERYSAEYISENKTLENKKSNKIAFFCDRGISIFLHYFKEIIENISKNKDLYIICSLYSTSRIEKLVKKDKIIPIDIYDLSNKNMENLFGEIKSKNFDLIYYFEVGTSHYNYFSPFFNLAKTQVCGFGTPSTTGIKNMDYMIQSSTLLSRKKNQEYFTEKLIYTKNILLIEHEGINKHIISQGIPKGNIYMFHHTHFKIHHEMDDTINNICNKDPDAKIIIGFLPFYSTLITLKKRLKSKMKDSFDKHILALPKLNHDQLLSVLRNDANVMLDTFYFGSATTAVEAIYSGLPIVTLPNLRDSHITYVVPEIYEVLGSQKLKDHCIADTKEDYINKAVAIATNKELKDELTNEIFKNISNIKNSYNNAVNEISELLIKLSEDTEYVT